MKSAKFNGHKVHLIETLEELNIIKSSLHERIYVGLDTETTGLDYHKDEIVGYCLSTGKSYAKEDYAGYYIPIRHSYGNNLDVKLTTALIQEIVDNYHTVLWNRTFDNFMMEKEGIRIPFGGFCNS